MAISQCTHWCTCRVDHVGFVLNNETSASVTSLLARTPIKPINMNDLQILDHVKLKQFHRVWQDGSGIDPTMVGVIDAVYPTESGYCDDCSVTFGFTSFPINFCDLLPLPLPSPIYQVGDSLELTEECLCEGTSLEGEKRWLSWLPQGTVGIVTAVSQSRYYIVYTMRIANHYVSFSDPAMVHPVRETLK